MFAKIITRYRHWRRLALDIYHLRGLDDHLLADLGVSRADICRFVHGRLRR
jgi:uncharacterized protein YjiS (DUF1127 family)